MNHLHTAKIVATMWPAIDKETVLSKIINQIDTFKISLTSWEEDIKRKYVHMILKLDNSKSIILDILWPEVRTRNKEERELSKDEVIIIQSSESFKSGENTLYIDYPHIQTLQPWSQLHIDHGEVIVEIIQQGAEVTAKVMQWGTVRINRIIEFINYIPILPFLSETDKKHIVRGLEHKIGLIALGGIRTSEDIQRTREYLQQIGGSHMKVIARIDTVEAIENINEIIQGVDGVSIDPTKWMLLMWPWFAMKKQEIIQQCNLVGKPILMNIQLTMEIDDTAVQQNIVRIQQEVQTWIDAFVLNHETAISEYPIELISLLHDTIYATEIEKFPFTPYTDVPIGKDKSITDYIIYSAYRASKEMNIKAIICPTETWYTAARLSSLKPNVPIIAFTKNDDAFRYLNILWWVKGYKIAPTFSYENIKQIGKEIIRILFKGNISLDDKVLIIHSSIEQNTKNMINGIEIYKFKDI
jgi:pyruvate kinase